jgi:hypothetical protein
LQIPLAHVKKTARFVLFFILTSLSLALFSYGTFYLKLFKHSEVKIEDSVVARFDVPTEYINNDSFWWLPTGKSNIKLINFSNSSFDGVLHLNITNNPCQNSESAKLGDRVFRIPKVVELEISQNFNIVALEQKSLELIITNSDDCFLSNGDSRNFGIRINGWKIDEQ